MLQVLWLIIHRTLHVFAGKHGVSTIYDVTKGCLLEVRVLGRKGATKGRKERTRLISGEFADAWACYCVINTGRAVFV